MISGKIIGDSEVVRHLKSIPANVRSEVRDTIGRIVLRLQRKTKQEKLTGQVLKVRTGTLRRSIDQVVVADGQAIVGIVSTNVKYGRVHEYGFKGQVSVKQHLREIKQVFGKTLKSPRQVSVSPHTRHVYIPERSFLRSALREMQPQILAEIDAAVAKGIK